MIYLTVASDNRVIARSIKQTKGTIPYDGEMPTVGDEQHLEYLNGKVIAVDNVSKSELRKQAYEVEVDPLVNKRNSYQIEADYYYPLAVKANLDGDTEAHDKYGAIYNHAKEMYDALTVEICEKKQEIRERYPNEVSE